MGDENRFWGTIGKRDWRLSRRQRQLLAELGQFMRDHRRPPTQVELAARLGVNKATVNRHIRILRVLGYVEHRPRKWRGIRIIRGA